VKLGRADPDFRTETELKAIAETDGRVDHNRGGVDFSEKPLRSLVIVGYNGFGVKRAVTANMVHRLIQAGHNFYRKDKVQVFGPPVFLGGGYGR